MYSRVLVLSLLALLGVFTIRGAAQTGKAPLKVAMLIPIEPWDRKAGLEAWRKWLEDHYRVEITWVEPAKPLPAKDATKEEVKAYYANPPRLVDLDKALKADVVFTALTHVTLNEKDSVEVLRLLTSKPVVGGRRSHHGTTFRLPKGEKIPGIENVGKYGDAIFGGGYAGHLGGTQQFKEGQRDHPIIKDLPDLVKFSLYDRGYKHKIVADEEVTVLIEMKETKDPQTWCRVNKSTKQRTFYTVHDPVDIEKHDSVRIMLTRALFWACEKTETAYKK